MHIGIQTHTGSEVFTPYVFAKQGEYRCDPCWMPTVFTEFVISVRVRVCRVYGACIVYRSADQHYERPHALLNVLASEFLLLPAREI